jgi:hypothetical protein
VPGASQRRTPVISSSCHRDGTVIVAMPLMRMMQVAFDEIVGVAAVRNRLMSATWPMSVLVVVRSTPMRRRTSGWIRAALRQCMFVDVTLMGAVKMSFVQIVDVTFMFDRGMAAAWTVSMGMLVMCFVVAHVTCLLPIVSFSVDECDTDRLEVSLSAA